MKPLTIDTTEFTRRGDAADGEWPVARLPRLASMLADDSGTVRWRLSGSVHQSVDGGRHRLLGLSLQTTVAMRCVRCLEPVAVPVAMQRDYRLVTSEGQAVREDPDDDDFDILVASPRFDVAELIEDEMVMALPFAPRHDDCQPPPVPAGEPEPLDEPAPNPFAALQRLRRPDGES
jgi:uncharacterized protein